MTVLLLMLETVSEKLHADKETLFSSQMNPQVTPLVFPTKSSREAFQSLRVPVEASRSGRCEVTACFSGHTDHSSLTAHELLLIVGVQLEFLFPQLRAWVLRGKPFYAGRPCRDGDGEDSTSPSGRGPEMKPQ